MKTKRASEIRVGDELIEGGPGGMAWRVDRLVHDGQWVTLTVNPTDRDMMLMKPWADQVKRYRSTTKLCVTN